LTVKFDELVWAGSNVYWVITSGNNGYLTFDATDKGNQGYQGVFFKWGSLVGVSPAQTGSSGAFSASTTVYVPTYNAGTPASSTWVRNASHGYTTAGWPSTVSGTAEDGAATIPYLDGRTAFQSADQSRNNTFVMDAERNTDAMYLEKRGDICQYIGKTAPNTEEGKKLKGFRLPTSSEFGTENEDWNGTAAKAGGWVQWTACTEDPAAGKPDGSADLLSAAAGKNNSNKVFGSIKNNAMGGVVLPAAGYRYNNNSGTLVSVGSVGSYWSGSIAEDDRGWRIDFNGTFVRPGLNTNRAFAFSVRCVKN
jgi:hypothetical protein